MRTEINHTIYRILVPSQANAQNDAQKGHVLPLSSFHLQVSSPLLILANSNQLFNISTWGLFLNEMLDV